MSLPFWTMVRWNLGELLARLPGVLRYDGPAPWGDRFVNRINGHCVVKS